MVGSIVRIVTDPGGAVMRGVKATATSAGTGVSQSTVTTDARTYRIASFLVGVYNLTAGAWGFKSGVTKGITLDVAQRGEVDFELVLGGVTSVVEVFPPQGCCGSDRASKPQDAEEAGPTPHQGL